MAKHAWRTLGLVGLMTTGVAVGCVFSVGDDPDPDSDLIDAGGSGNVFVPDPAGGAGGLGGAGGSTPLASCNPNGELDNEIVTDCSPDSENACQVCVATNCCDEFEACVAENPKDVCGWDRQTGEWGGEYVCWLTCIEDPAAEGLEGPTGTQLFPFTEEAWKACESHCATESCGGTLSATTTALIECILDDVEDDTDDASNCELECALPE